LGLGGKIDLDEHHGMRLEALGDLGVLEEVFGRSEPRQLSAEFPQDLQVSGDSLARSLVRFGIALSTRNAAR
jgi:hypothetical protein